MRAIRGSIWTLSTSVSSRAIGLVSTLILARYVAPAEYGEVSAAWILMVTSISITTFGVGIYVVANRDVSRAETFHATCWFLSTGVAVVAITVAFSGSLGSWFGAPNLTRFVPMFALVAILERVIYLPERMLVRSLRFGWLSVSRALGELTYATVSVALAVLGAGAMAIAWGNLARSLVRLVAIVPSVDRREWLEPHRLHFATMRTIIVYGLNVSVAAIASFGMRRWDNLLVSRFFGPATMGAYNYAYNLAETPGVAVGEQMSDVVGASFPHVQRERRSAALVNACIMMSLITFPLAFGLATVAPTLVQAFFNEQWAAVGTMLVFLSALSATRPLVSILASYLYAQQRPGSILWLEWSSLAALVLGVTTIGRVGILWTCAVVITVFVLNTLAYIWLIHRQDEIAFSAFLYPLARPLLACMIMVGAILAVRPALGEMLPALRLAIEIALGAGVYVGAVSVIAGAASRDFLRLAHSALSSQ